MQKCRNFDSYLAHWKLTSFISLMPASHVRIAPGTPGWYGRQPLHRATCQYLLWAASLSNSQQLTFQFFLFLRGKSFFFFFLIHSSFSNLGKTTPGLCKRRQADKLASSITASVKSSPLSSKGSWNIKLLLFLLENTRLWNLIPHIRWKIHFKMSNWYRTATAISYF